MRLGLRRTPHIVTLLALAIATAAAVPAAGQVSASLPRVATEELELPQLTGPLMLELEGAPAAEVYANEKSKGASNAAAGSASKAQKSRNASAQESVVSAVGRDDVLYTVQMAYNGVAVAADSPADAARFAALPGVAAVHPIPLAEASNASSVGFIGAHQAWQAYGRTGEGMTIAVIDTGIDYVHTGFGGSGSAADYAAAKSPANNVENANRSTPFSIPGVYPTAKVIGGHDLAGDAYNASIPGPTQVPRPDRNPMDCNGHGTHVAGTAAGNGVNADGSTYTGPYNASLPASTMRIGPGVAPEAKIVFYRVFGCAGGTFLTPAAIDMAIDPNGDGDPSDHVDVINMSLGAAYGTADDPSAAASQTAALNDVIVVAAAGNDSDNYYVTGSPGSSTRTISVASSTDPVDVADAFRVNSPAGVAGLYGASRSVNFNWLSPPATAPLPLTANLYYPATNRFGCSAWTDATDLSNIAGKIVLVDWKVGNEAFPCGSGARTANARAAGARGVIMADSVPYLDASIGGDALTPAMYTTSTVGAVLKAALTPGPVSITFSAEFLNSTKIVTPGRGDMLSGFSSRGPRSRGAALKPDISAPGQGIFSVDNDTGNQGVNNQGTSMASPHVAGVMALLKSARPTWSVEELKALAMNTAGHDVFTGLGQTGDRYGVARVGAGRVDVPAALGNDVVAYDADGAGAVSVSFGAVEVLGQHAEERTVRVVNRGATARTFTKTYDRRTDIPGVEISFPGSAQVNVPAGGSATFRVRLTANAAQMQNTRDTTVAGTQTVAGIGALPRHWLSEESGLIILAPHSGGAILRVPVYVTARPATKMGASGNTVTFRGANATSQSIHLSGQDVATGTEPLGWVSKVSAFELQGTSPRASLPTGVSELARNADIRYVGAAMDESKSEVFFGISTWGEWATPATDVQFNVQIDLDGDGSVDRTLFNTRFAATDIFVTALLPGIVADFTNYFSSSVNTAPFDNDVVVMPLPLSLLPAGTGRFKYRVQGISRFWPQIDQTDWMTYDVKNPGLAFTGGLADTPIFPDLGSTNIGVALNRAAYAANASQGVLLLHHFNEQGNRAEVLRVNS